MSVDFNLLPYLPNREHMKDSEVRVCASLAQPPPHNRCPGTEAWITLLEENEYLVKEVKTSGNHTWIFAQIPYDPDPEVCMSISILREGESITMCSLSQCSFEDAIALTLLLCKKYGPFYLGYNSFDVIFLVDESTDPALLLHATAPSEDASLVQMAAAMGNIPEEPVYDDTDPLRKKLLEGNEYLQATELLCTIVAEQLEAQGYVRRGHGFFCAQDDRILSIHPLYIFYTAQDTFFIRACLACLDKRPYRQAGIALPDFPSSNFFEKKKMFPAKTDMVQWKLKYLEGDRVTDLEWMENNKEEIAAFAKDLPSIAGNHFSG